MKGVKLEEPSCHGFDLYNIEVEDYGLNFNTALYYVKGPRTVWPANCFTCQIRVDWRQKEIKPLEAFENQEPGVFCY